ncbi:MAG TPA: hypothetical protein VLA52_12050, partial [Thermohalobaculum sp.]|nr:hypothetical protein [Thermohalobaculum sp.]
APGPVISDDMVMVLQAGKEVVWEAAIFAELAALGVWDQRPFIEMIEAKRFSFFITIGSGDDPVFNRRYSPRVRSAIDAAYPDKQVIAGYTVHFPLP